MRRDPLVWALGEDLSAPPTAAPVPTNIAGLIDEFGPKRVVNTPISENTIMGAAVGAAVAGTQAGCRSAHGRLRHVRRRLNWSTRQPRSATCSAARRVFRWSSGRPSACARAARRSIPSPPRPGTYTRRGWSLLRRAHRLTAVGSSRPRSARRPGRLYGAQGPLDVRG